MDSLTIAISIVKKLVQHGHIAYFAGGWVRDHLMGHPSDDIDIATDATPQQIIALFPHTLLVGLAFGIVVVVIQGQQFEVATFRRDGHYLDGRKPSQIELSTPEEDASRRDFTINGMFYDPLSEEIYDYVNGQEDIHKKVIRTIGNSQERFKEDRLRMIRAVRFAARFDFIIDLSTQEAIISNADHLFPSVSMERIWQEFVKMSANRGFDFALIELHQLKLLPVIFPSLNNVSIDDIRDRVSSFNSFPPFAKTILFLMELFPEAKLNEGKLLCGYLKTSLAEGLLAELLIKVRLAIIQEQQEKSVDKIEWTYLLANPNTWTCLEIIAAKMDHDHRLQFLAEQKAKEKSLEKHIQRVIQKTPIVNATSLQRLGIAPGKQMGHLLKEAEKIAIFQDLSDPCVVLEQLKMSPFWKGN